VTIPFLDRRWNPARKRAWESLDQLNSLFYKIIGGKRQSVQQAIAQNTVDEKNLDLLSLMILASEEEEIPLNDQELRVMIVITTNDTSIDNTLFRTILVASSLRVMTQHPLPLPLYYTFCLNIQ
jgi:hypothetical protein